MVIMMLQSYKTENKYLKKMLISLSCLDMFESRITKLNQLLLRKF